MDLAPIYQTITTGPETVLVAHHGQVTVVHKTRPTIHKASVEIFELGAQVDLATVVQLAQHLGLAPRDERALLQHLDEQLAELEAEYAGVLDERLTAQALLAQALRRLYTAKQDRNLLSLQLERQAQHNREQAEQLRAADFDRDELRRQVAALRRSLDAAAEASALPTPPRRRRRSSPRRPSSRSTRAISWSSTRSASARSRRAASARISGTARASPQRPRIPTLPSRTARRPGPSAMSRCWRPPTARPHPSRRSCRPRSTASGSPPSTPSGRRRRSRIPGTTPMMIGTGCRAGASGPMTTRPRSY